MFLPLNSGQTQQLIDYIKENGYNREIIEIVNQWQSIEYVDRGWRDISELLDYECSRKNPACPICIDINHIGKDGGQGRCVSQRRAEMPG